MLAFGQVRNMVKQYAGAGIKYKAYGFGEGRTLAASVVLSFVVSFSARFTLIGHRWPQLQGYSCLVREDRPGVRDLRSASLQPHASAPKVLNWNFLNVAWGHGEMVRASKSLSNFELVTYLNFAVPS